MHRITKFLFPVAALILATTALVFSALAYHNQDQTSQHQPVASIPSTVNYQGFLTDETGEPVDGPETLQFDGSSYNFL
jgi:hypothetical protein